jgi:hypothetical protein
MNNKQKSSVQGRAAPAKKSIQKSSANLVKITNQTAFLERYLRGTGRTLSEAQAMANYGIKNLSARMSELRQAGLKVLAAPNSTGKVAYSVSARSNTGSRARVFLD